MKLLITDIFGSQNTPYKLVLICILIELGWVYESIISTRSDKQRLRFKQGGLGGHPLRQIC